MMRCPVRVRLIWTWLALAASLFLAGCGSTAIGPTPAPPGPLPTVTVPLDLPVVISIVGSFNDPVLGILDQQIAAFEEANPDIVVEVVETRGDAEARRQQFAESLAQADSSRDIFVIDYHYGAVAFDVFGFF